MTLFRSVVLFVAVFLPAIASAAPITGQVLDGQTFRPLRGATLSWGDNTVTTDRRGRFQLDAAPGKLALQVSAEGYQDHTETLTVKPRSNKKLVIVMFPPGVMSEVVEVSSTAPVTTDAPAKQTMAREEITRIPGTQGDALQAIKSLPGVANADAPGAGPGLIVIRGAAPEDSKITIDGIEVPLVYHFFGLQSVLPSELIETIEFLPGGFEADEGRSTGGVINIKTRANRVDKIQGFAELSFINFAGFLQGPVSRKRDIQFALGLRRSAIDLLLPAVIPDTVRFTTAPQYYDGQARIDWRPNARNRLTALGLFSYDLLRLLNDNVNPNDPALSGSFENETIFSRLITSWNYTTPKLQSRVLAAAGTQSILVQLGDDNFGKGAVWRIETRADARYQLDKKLRLRFGGEARYARGNFRTRAPLPPAEGTGMVPTLSTQPIVDLDEDIDNELYALYLMADLQPVPGTTITPGVRLDHYQRFDATEIMPRLSVRQRIDSRWMLRAALGIYTRPLERNESLATFLTPERATHYVLGAEYKIAPGIRATGSAFYTDRRNLVVFDADLGADDPIRSYINRGYGRAFGVEALLRIKRSNFFGWLAYTLSRSDRVDDADSPRRLFDFDQPHNLIVVGSYKWGRWQFGGRWQYSTGNPSTPILGGIYQSDLNVHLPVVGAINSTRIDAAHQLDLRVDRTWSFRTWKLSAYLDIQNAYLNPRILGFTYNFDYTERQAIEEIPILPALGVRGSF